MSEAEQGDLTPLQQDERDALTGDRQAVLRVVSGLREYRAAVKAALDSRWADGAIDGVRSASLEAASLAAEGLE